MWKNIKINNANANECKCSDFKLKNNKKMRYEIVIENKLNMKNFSYVFCIRMMKIETKKLKEICRLKIKRMKKMNMKKIYKMKFVLIFNNALALAQSYLLFQGIH